MACRQLIPQSVTNLDLDPRESSPGSTIASPLVLEIQRDLRSIEPRGFDAVQIQVCDRLWYNLKQMTRDKMPWGALFFLWGDLLAKLCCFRTSARKWTSFARLYGTRDFAVK